ncbi:kinase [Streptomyces sulfonofaciens]|uniref:Kinase n=1 Tax=Streptomyces sulfonofaciens TaxID=68272 RepID=A0A919FZD7_9ACTN|nr:carbohydrate kinase family protein [Streptomyces sulfonofaciens]GHH74415.1 kinase [Streptomyces sulfonofaciens]
MRIAVTGSIATDHLMTFPGRFADQFIAEQLHTVSLSFLVDTLEVRRGGVAPNICFGMGQLGVAPVLVGAAGADFGEYRAWLERHGVDTASVRISEVVQTARFVCTTDADHNQIGSFYAGAMREARLIELKTVADRVQGLDLVLISADDPEAMLRHTEECRSRSIPFAADFSQQIARMDGDGIRTLLDGASYLFSNEYEKGLIESKTGWSDEEILGKVGHRVTTLGARGVRIEACGEDPVEVGVPQEEARADPTGVGDAFRAGFLSGVAWGVGLERAAQLGCMLATLVIETVGTQEYELRRDHFVDRFAKAYGDGAAADIHGHLARVLSGRPPGRSGPVR